MTKYNILKVISEEKLIYKKGNRNISKAINKWLDDQPIADVPSYLVDLHKASQNTIATLRRLQKTFINLTNI